MHYYVAGITERHAVLLKEILTVDINITANVGAAKRVGNLAGNRFCKEGVVHNNLICVSRDLLDYTSSFGPPGERIRRQRKERRCEMKKEGKGEKALRQVFTHPCVNSILLCE